MSEGPERPPVAALAEALDVARNARIGLVAGVLVALSAYAYRVGELGGPTSATRGSPLLFLMLAFVLALSAGALVTVALTVRSAVRLARESD